MPNEGGGGKQNRHFEGELMKNIPPPPPLAPVNRRMKQNRHGWGLPTVHFQVSQHALMTQLDLSIKGLKMLLVFRY